MLGSVSSPYKLTISGTTGINGLADKGEYNVYPSPVRSTLYVNGDLEHLSAVYVIANNGVIVAKRIIIMKWTECFVFDGRFLYRGIEDIFWFHS